MNFKIQKINKMIKNKAIFIVSLLLIALIGCSQGSYPLDFFYEMHYTQSYKSYEPPRLDVPASAVPVYEAAKSTSYYSGEHLYDVNCVMCHGTEAKGDGPALMKIINDYGYSPAVTPDLTSPEVKSIGVNGVKGYLYSGVVVMPSFKKMLSEEEMNMISEYVLSLD
jgi:mono/diheme cytochrome c family protein